MSAAPRIPGFVHSWPLALAGSVLAHGVVLSVAFLPHPPTNRDPQTAQVPLRLDARLAQAAQPAVTSVDSAPAARQPEASGAREAARETRRRLAEPGANQEAAPPVLVLHRETAVARAALPEGISGTPAPAPLAAEPPPTPRDPTRPPGAQTAPLAADHGDVARHTDVAYLHTPRPSYPHLARSLGIEGTVKLRVLVNAEGLPEEARVLTSSGTDALDAAALEGVKRWRFAPARDGERAISHWVDIPVRFRLADR